MTSECLALVDLRIRRPSPCVDPSRKYRRLRNDSKGARQLPSGFLLCLRQVQRAPCGGLFISRGVPLLNGSGLPCGYRRTFVLPDLTNVPRCRLAYSAEKLAQLSLAQERPLAGTDKIIQECKDVYNYFLIIQ